MTVTTTNNLDGKVALVTGSGRGIGRALARKLASHGARVVVNDLDQAATDETVADIRAEGGTALGCAGTVTDPAFAARFIGTALTTWGGLDIIVNNAGYTWDSVIQKMTDEQFEAMLDVHVKAPFRILLGPIRDGRDDEDALQGMGPCLVIPMLLLSLLLATRQPDLALTKMTVIDVATGTRAPTPGRGRAGSPPLQHHCRGGHPARPAVSILPARTV